MKIATNLDAPRTDAPILPVAIAQFVDAMKAVSKSPLSPSEKVHQLKDLYAKARQVATSHAYVAALAGVMLEQLKPVAGPLEITRFFAKRLFDAVLRRNAAVQRPAPVQTPFVMNDNAYDASRSYMAAFLSAMVYAAQDEWNGAIKTLGFDHNTRVTDWISSAEAVVVSRPNDLAAVAFCGTKDAGDFVTDARMRPVSRKELGPGRVPEGFATQLDSIWPEVKKGIIAARKEDPKRPILFTGHSLGGALAVLAFVRAKREGLLDPSPTGEPTAVLHTSGQPMTGDREFMGELDRLLEGQPKTSYVREIYRGDPITQMPFKRFGFVHSTAATIVYHDGSGSTKLGTSDAPPLTQDLAEWATIIDEVSRRLVDHNELNYVVATLANRMNGKDGWR